MEEIAKSLAPWPILQAVFGMLVLAVGVSFIVRGLRGPDPSDDKRAEWEAYNQLRNIDQNPTKIVESNQRILEALQTLNTILWNRDQR
jgi:hypothetical protein